MKNKKIAIARLRSKVKYIKPLEHILDSFYFLIDNFISKYGHSVTGDCSNTYEFSFYNISFDHTTPRRNPDVIKNADIIIIPTENEFHYHVPNYIHPGNLEKSNQAIELIKPYLENKKIILLRSDRADSPELYKEYTLNGVNCDIDVIDEIDFLGNVHILKYHFIKQFLKTQKNKGNKNIDFCYWGTDKRKMAGGEDSGDPRHLVLKAIDKEKSISTKFIGRFSNIKRDLKMSPMSEVVTHIEKAHTTLCFNWMNPRATTSRYHETVACNCIPLVYGDYDIDNILVASPEQRIYSKEEAIDKIKQISKDGVYRQKLITDIMNKYEKDTLRPPEEFINTFENLLKQKLQ
jgi:hypothetical protein